MSTSFIAAAADRALAAGVECESDHEEPPLINCLMLIRWPERRTMIEEAVHSFACQDYPRRALVVVNDGAPCCLCRLFRRHVDATASSGTLHGFVVSAPAGSSIGAKRNLGVAALPEASFVASFDDDDLSLPKRLSSHIAAIGANVWLSASRKYISLDSLSNIIGFEMGRCYGAGMISTRVTRTLAWPQVSYCEDHKLYAAVKSDPHLGALMVEDDTLLYLPPLGPTPEHETRAYLYTDVGNGIVLAL